MLTYALYSVTGILLLISASKDKKKTKMALKKAWKSFQNMNSHILSILLLIGIVLTILDKQVIAEFLGNSSGIVGLCIAASVGSITLIPGFAAFPLAASLLKNGAGYGQIAMFISTLMMVGVVTLPLEMSCFGKRIAIKRNIFAFFFSIIAALIIGGVFQ